MAIPNPRSIGPCSECMEPSTRLFERPLLQVPLALTDSLYPGKLYEPPSQVWWNPGGAGGRNLYDVVGRGEEFFLVPYERNQDDLCWRCWLGGLCPSEYVRVVNWPPEFTAIGWRGPIWIPLSKRTTQ